MEQRPAQAEPPGERQAEPSELDQAESRSSLGTLNGVLSAAGDIEDAKFLAYLTGDAEAAEPDPSRMVLDAEPAVVADSAARARVQVHVVRVADRAGGADPRLERIARATGGTVSVVTRKRADLSVLLTALSSGYIVEIEPAVDDRDGRVHALDVRAARKGLVVVAATRWAARDDALPAPVEMPEPTVEVTAAERAPAAQGIERSRRSRAPDPELQAVLARASSYADRYVNELGNVVAQEKYRQVVRWPYRGGETRSTLSDLLLVRTKTGWTPFRDVIEVDGKPLPDREDRLRTLFLERPDEAMAEGRRISEEGARYNLGQVFRTINTPTITLGFLLPTVIGGFHFERHGTDKVEGVTTWRLDFVETGRPTQITQASTGRDLPSEGSIWVEPTSGRVVKTRLRNGDEGVFVEVVVTYRPNDALGPWTPAEMREMYRRPRGGESIDTEATYLNFRRFIVDTAESLGPPR